MSDESEIIKTCEASDACPYFTPDRGGCVGTSPGCSLKKKYLSTSRAKLKINPSSTTPPPTILPLPLNELIIGDCATMMRSFPENSIDCIVTDPPYGLSFMGKDWDKALPPVVAFEQMFRVLKPGALAFVMSSPRQDLMARMLLLLEGVGFNTNLSYIDWIYKTGFPKAYDVSKGIDKRGKRTRENLMRFSKHCQEMRDRKNLSNKDIDEYLGLNSKGATASHYTCVDGQQPRFPSIKNYFKLKELLEMDDRFDDIIKEYEREIIGYHKGGETSFPMSYQAGSDKKGSDITLPMSDDAKRWEGWKSQTGLKPAHEPILMVYKPRSEKTIVDNVLRWGTGAINVDSSRIPFEHHGSIANNPLLRLKSGAKIKYGNDSHSSSFKLKKEAGEMNINKKGRFPANLLVSDKALDTGEITKSGDLLPHHNLSKDEEGFMKRKVYGKLQRQEEHFYGDSGDQSRFFDLDVWAMGKGICDTPKPSKRERGAGNTHPTVKPIKLMAYLIELGCPPDGVVLDPFMGSGTTCIAAKMLGRKWIGIELNAEYAAIAEARIMNVDELEGRQK